jgi:hypothetical protein
VPCLVFITIADENALLRVWGKVVEVLIFLQVDICNTSPSAQVTDIQFGAMPQLIGSDGT